MRITKLPVVGVVCGLSLIAACHRSQENNNNTPDAFVNPTGACTPSGTRVQDVQNDAMAVGTPVTLSCVVVTALDAFGAKTGDIWVEDMGGGPYSGIHLFNPAAPNFNSLAVGDLVNITGAAKSEFPTPTTPPPYYSSVTELVSAPGGQLTVTKVGTGTAPAPYVLDLQTFASMSTAAQNAEYEKWEGVLITVNNVTATGAPAGFGSMPFPPDAFGVGIDANFSIDSNLADFPASVAATACFASVTGVVDYVTKWLIYPRTTDEMVLGGTGCAGATTATVTDIQNGTVPTGTIVKLSSVFVTAVELGKNGTPASRMWVADSLTAAADNGMLLFLAAPADKTLAVGAQVDVIGPVLEFGLGGNKFTELSGATATLHAAPGAVLPMPLAVDDVTKLSDIVNGEPFEGSLVQLSNVKVTGTGPSTNQVILTDNAGGTIIMDDDAFDNYSGTGTAMVPPMGTCFGTVIGVMNGVSTATVNVRSINPRSAADMVVGTSCTN